MKLSTLLTLAVTLATTLLLGGCSESPILLLDPDGPIARSERNLLLIASAVMLCVIVPVWLLTIWFAVRYRASNTRAQYSPDWSYSATLDAIVWLVPAAIIIALGWLVWTGTHRLDPYRAIDSANPPLEIEVVAQDWRWLFIYPEQDIAVINELIIPVNRPVRLKLTSDTVMNSFYIAGLAGQIYTMAGMRTELNLWADKPAHFIGRNMQYSGKGFSDQHFPVRAGPQADFDSWVARVRAAPATLDAGTYEALALTRKAMPVTYYGGVEPGLFDDIIASYHSVEGTVCRPRFGTLYAATEVR
jgi:cytochrome o ubiquinol oxidase subunit II